MSEIQSCRPTCTKEWFKSGCQKHNIILRIGASMCITHAHVYECVHVFSFEWNAWELLDLKADDVDRG